MLFTLDLARFDSVQGAYFGVLAFPLLPCFFLAFFSVYKARFGATLALAAFHKVYDERGGEQEKQGLLARTGSKNVLL